MGYMLENCPQSCKLCTKYYDSEPPAFTTLWNGLLMRTVGFGTAGLGGETEEAVSQALEVGYTHLDSAQGRAWYREDSTGKVGFHYVTSIKAPSGRSVIAILL